MADPYLTWSGKESWSSRTKESDLVTSQDNYGSAMAVSAKFSEGRKNYRTHMYSKFVHLFPFRTNIDSY